MQSGTTAPEEEPILIHESGNHENVEQHRVHDVDKISSQQVPLIIRHTSVTTSKNLESNIADQNTPSHGARTGLNSPGAHQPLPRSHQLRNTLEVGVAQAVSQPGNQTIPNPNMQGPPSLSMSTFATASPLLNHHAPSTLRQRGPCEASGAVLINNQLSKTPTTTHGERGGRRGSRLPPRTLVGKKKKQGPPKGRSAQTARRGNGFTQNETESLLELLEEHLPLAKEEWEKVARLHELRYPQQNRNTDSIRRKFSALCRTVPPTGDPSIPPDVLKAKEIRKAMTERADIGYGEDSECEYTEEMNDYIAPAPAPQTATTSASAGTEVPYTEPDVPEEQQFSKSGPTAPQSNNPTPRPLVRKRSAPTANDDDSIMAALKASIVQEQMRREEDFRLRMLEKEEEKKRREEERHIREQERLDDRERRAEERQRSDRMMQMMFVAFLGPRASSMFTDSENSPNNT